MHIRIMHIAIMRIEDDIKLDYSDVLIKPKRSTMGSRKEVLLQRSFKFLNTNRFPDHDGYHYNGTPIMAANMDGVGTIEMAEELSDSRLFTCLTKTLTVSDMVEFFMKRTSHTENAAMSIGIKDEDYDKFIKVESRVGDRIKYLCIDVANGYSQRFIEFIQRVREEFPEIVIIAGNVVTGDQTQELILRGADLVKVGIGSGAVCLTRTQTGVGYPQLSAVMECADAAHGLGGHIVADGGCTCPGDVAKAFAAGADFTMLGGMLAGHDEGGGEVIEVNGEKLVQFYGMSSKTANEKHFDGLKDYRASEGRTVMLPYRGAISGTIQNILGGIRSTLTYVGARKLKQLSKCTTFIRVNNQLNRVYENASVGD